MGGSESKPVGLFLTEGFLKILQATADAEQSTPPPEPLLSSPWRDITWSSNNLDDIRGKIRATDMPSDVEQPKILLYGLVGAGKSSFINSIISISKGRISAPVQAGSSAGSYTTKFRCIKDKEFQNFQLCDTMGLEMTSGNGIVLDDVLSLIKGHIKNGYEFHPARPIDERSPDFIQCPERKDKVSCVIFVVPARTIRSDLPSEVKHQIDEVQKVIKGRDMSRILVITKIDEVCDKTRDNIRMVYRSKVLKETAEKGARIFNMPVTNVHLVKNYCSEQELDTDISILLLRALLHSVESAADYLEFQ